jgi:isoquinoline 1-oxidoreductase beta subunit
VWSAMQGRRALNVTWDEGPNKDLNSAQIYSDLRQAASAKAAMLYSAGDVSKISGRRIEAEYQLPFMAHAPMEPGNCVADFHGDSCDIWAPTQVPQDVRDSVGQALSIDPDKVRVNITLLGGGFGRRLEHDYGVEAALVSKAAGTPVKVIWTREDDMRNSTYRPASYHKLSAVLDGAGWPVAFSHRIVMPGINVQKGTPAVDGTDPEIKDEASFVYDFPNAVVDHVMTETPIPLGWMRSVNALQVGFAAESFIDEIDAAGHKDPLQLR